MKIRGQTVFDPEVRIQRLSVVDVETGCWNWTGSKSNMNGYGRLIVGSRSDRTRKTMAAHRYSFEIFNGNIPDGIFVCHKCDNPKCVNPDHLFLGTRQDNVDDRENKNRNNHVIGEKVGTSKLSEKKIKYGRELRCMKMSYQNIAHILGVSKKTAMQAIKGETWKHMHPSNKQDATKPPPPKE